MTTLRVLTTQGEKKFEEYLLTLKQANQEPFPLQEINHAPWSEEFVPVIEVEQKAFTTRMQMGMYLTELFTKAGIKAEELANRKSLWSWLAAYWFKSICPPQEDGYRKVRETASYVCSLDWRDYHRHLVGATWYAYSRHGQYSRLFLHSPPNQHNDFMEQLASKQSIISGRSIMEVADRLYWDNVKKQPKTNASNRTKLGNVRRFVAVIWQLEMTYDVYSMSADKILALLPAEFQQWVN